MNILWINHRDPKHPEAGGAEVHLAEVTKRLVRSGHSVTILAERFRDSKEIETAGRLTVLRFGGRVGLHIFAPYFVSHESHRADVIVDDAAHAVPFWSPLFTRKPVVAIVHHVHQGVLRTEVNPLLRGFIGISERSIKYAYENVLTVSESTKRDLIEKLGVSAERIRVIHDGIDHEKYRPGDKFQSPTILWLGRMKKYKNLDQAVRAFAIVKESVPDAVMIIAGDGEEKDRILKLVKTIGVHDITFAGWVTEREKIRLLQGVWCVVYTSKIEGWGMGVLEGAACGTPTVAYDSGALREAVVDGETGLLTEYGDYRVLSSKITEMLRDKHMRATTSANAHEFSELFDWDKTALETERYLMDLL